MVESRYAGFLIDLSPTLGASHSGVAIGFGAVRVDIRSERVRGSAKNESLVRNNSEDNRECDRKRCRAVK